MKRKQHKSYLFKVEYFSLINSFNFNQQDEYNLINCINLFLIIHMIEKKFINKMFKDKHFYLSFICLDNRKLKQKEKHKVIKYVFFVFILNYTSED